MVLQNGRTALLVIMSVPSRSGRITLHGVSVLPTSVYRWRNSFGRVRVGASLGSNTDKFLGGIHLGYEQDYSLRGGWRIFWQVKGDCLIKNDDLFRVGAAVGVAIPCNKRR